MKSHNNINKTNDLASIRLDINRLTTLRDDLRRTHQRALLVYQAEREKCLSWLQSLRQEVATVLISDQLDVGDEALPYSKAEILLGHDVEVVVVDLYSGLNVDVLCMAQGLVKAGGLLMLLSPPDIEQMDDRYGQWQGQNNSTHNFIHYFFNALADNPVVMFVKPGHSLTLLPDLPISPLTSIVLGKTSAQLKILEHLQQWLFNKKQKQFFLTAERGRGKSTTLGLFVNAQSSKNRIVVTAASRAQASVLLNTVEQKHRVDFIAPDELIRRQAKIECLIVDEAAMLPYHLLQQCISLSSKTILATTTGGYEGTGQGFLLKFMAEFNPLDYVHEQLKEPVRWGQQDLLEGFLNKTLMLDIRVSIPEKLAGDVTIESFDKRELNKAPESLAAIYALLVSAHYRTRPSDLRQLMDDENQQILLARIDQSIIAVLLLNREGGFSADLSEQVFMGRRRPQGHLFAQMITAQAGIRHFACWQGFRVQRITVHERYRRMGIGRELIDKAQQLVEEQGLDYLGSSFALDATVAPFWKSLGFESIHLSAGKGKSSGRQTIAVIKSNKPDIKILIQTLKNKIQQDLPVMLLGYCRNMLWQDVLALLEMTGVHISLTALDHDEIQSFAQGFRGFDLAQPALQRLLIEMLKKRGLLNESQQQLLIEKVLQNKPWYECHGFKENVGKKGLTKKIRHLVSICYDDKYAV